MEAPHLGALITLVLCLAARPVGASDAVAESMFRSAIEKMEAGQFADACPLLEASFAREERSGTLLMLANCYENVGKTATAWATYRDAASLARTEDRLHIAEKAETYAKPLEPKLSKLVVVVADAPSGLEVRLDDRLVPPASFAVAFAVDPGPHRVEARAPGHTTWSLQVVIGDDADRQTVRIPSLTRVSPPAPSPPLTAPEPSPSPTPIPPPEPDRGLDGGETAIPVAAWVIGGISIATGIAALAFAIDQQVVASELDERCGGTARDACEPGYDFESTRDREVLDLGLALGLGVGALIGAATTTAIVVTSLSEDDQPSVSLTLGPRPSVMLRW
jgi:serine/threonine-protein kinase